MMVESRGDRGVMLLIHGLWFRPSVWAPWLQELDEAGYDAAVLSWADEDQPSGRGSPGSSPDFDALLRIARRHIATLGSRPIVIGHGVGGSVSERLLLDGDAAAAISLAPVPRGYPAIPAAARLLRRRTSLALLSMRGSAVVPTFPAFRRTIANVSGDADARHHYEKHVTTATPRNVLLHAMRDRAPATRKRPSRGPLLLAAGGKDELIGEMSTALRHRSYRRRQPDAITDYKIFPGLDHTLGLGTEGMAVLFYCLDWLTAQNM
jgi:pimeloyl-ACP methyl ester carboxylesterase